MVTNQMLLIPRIVLHALIVVDALKDHLTEAVKIGNSRHLRVKQFSPRFDCESGPSAPKSLEIQRETDLSPAFDAIFDHQMFG